MKQLLRKLRKRIEIVPDEPGTMLLLLIVGVFLLFTPGGACNYDAAASATPTVEHLDDAHDH